MSIIIDFSRLIGQFFESQNDQFLLVKKMLYTIELKYFATSDFRGVIENILVF